MTRYFIPALAAGLALSAFVSPPAARAQSQRYVPYKGQLERNGQPVTGTVNIVFSLWSAQTAGTELHSETQAVQVTGGNFAVRIGPVPEAAFAQTELYLGLTVDGTLLGGRQLVQTSPYAVRGQPGQPFRTDQLVVANNNVEAAVDVVSINGRATLVAQHLDVGGVFSNPRIGAFPPIANSNMNNMAGGSATATFVDTGGTIVLLVSGSAYGTQAGRIQLQVRVDGQTVGALRQFINTGSVNQHVALPPAFIRLDRNLIGQVPLGTSVTRTLEIVPINCGPNNTLCSPGIVTTVADQNDFVNVMLLRLGGI